jgi:Lsr2
MAQKTQVILTDDIDGSDASQTISFAYQGVDYEIDLNDDHAAALQESFHDWIQAARKVNTRAAGSKATGGARSTSRRSSAENGRDVNAVRTWLRENGHEVSDRGRIAQKLLDAYDAAH